jgi:hypothetical protein
MGARDRKVTLADPRLLRHLLVPEQKGPIRRKQVGDGPVERSGPAPDPVVHLPRAVHRHVEAADAGVEHLAQCRRREEDRVGVQMEAPDAGRPGVAHELDPVATDQRAQHR